MGKKEAPKVGNGAFTRSANPFGQQSRDVAPRCKLDAAPGLIAAVQAVIDMGGAVLLGGTRDGGAYSITLLVDEHRHKTYVHDPKELHDAVQAMLQLSV